MGLSDTPEALRRSMTAGQREVGVAKAQKRSLGGPTTSEQQFQKQVIDLAHLFGWTVAHFKAAPTPGNRGWATPVHADGKGFPDLVLVRDRVVFVELKGSKGKLRPDQVVWLAKLADADAETYVWRPDDLAAVQEALR